MAETIEQLKKIIAHYEQNGPAKLFYALNRKSSELADMMNKQSLADLDLADAKDKRFDRLKIAWNEAASIATAIKILGDTAGITNDETSDTNKAVFRRPITSETMADAIGELAGQR